VVRGNDAIARHAQVRAEDVPGQKCYNLLRGADSPCEGCPLPQAIKSGTMASGRLNLPRRQVIFEASAYPVHQASQDNLRFVCLYHDVTEEEKNRDKLIQVQKMAALGHLSGAVAHEINNPLGGILAFAQILKRDAEEGSEPHMFLNHIEDAAVRCRDIVRKLLSYARSSPSEERQVTSLGSLVQKALDLNQHMLNLSNIEVRWREADGAAEAPVLVNAVDIQGLYINLIQNAHDAMEGGGTLTINLRLDTELSPPVVVSEVSDSGSGIKPENLTRIFDPFFTTKEVGRGTGLGLSLAFQSVQSNNGTIEVDSVWGEGTTFTIAFPVVLDAEVDG
jgi:two-component system NtrC family sensor kinase